MLFALYCDAAKYSVHISSDLSYSESKRAQLYIIKNFLSQKEYFEVRLLMKLSLAAVKRNAIWSFNAIQ